MLYTPGLMLPRTPNRVWLKTMNLHIIFVAFSLYCYSTKNTSYKINKISE